MLERIYIDNFRCFSNFEFRPARVNLLFGRNGSGKTALLDALRGVLRNVLSGEPLEVLFPPRDRTRWDTRTEQRFELEATLDGARHVYLLRVEQDADGRRTTLTEEVVRRDGQVLFAYRDGAVHLYDNEGQPGASFPFRGGRSFLPQMEARPENTRLMRFLDYLRRSRVVKLLPPVIEGTTREESSFLGVDGFNFASWYRHLSQERPAELHALFESLRRAIPGFRSLALVGAGHQGRTRELVANFEVPGGGDYSVDFGVLSDGQRALVVLYTLLVDLRSPEPRLVLLDEPENFVGLSELQPWLECLDDVLGDTGQLLVISHHPEVIDALAAEHPVHFEREGGGPVRTRTEVFDREGGLRASEQIVRGLLDDA